jgi:hypothetical protein
MKKLCCLLLLSIPLLGFSQTDSSGIPIPMKNGKIWYEEQVHVSNSVNKDVLYQKAMGWLEKTCTGPGPSPISNDKLYSSISGKCLFKVVTGASGNYFWIRPAITITITEGGYTFQATDYYEKPIVKGISNEYSKIEYRWRDYRKGKPWTTEDQTLFTGIQEQSLSLMALLKQAMNP